MATPTIPHSKKKNSDYHCGLLSWKPRWLQRFASPKAFVIVYGTLGFVQAMGIVYFIGTVSTLERRFGIHSKTTGWMVSGNDISHILMSPVLSYMGGNKNRPVWIAWGVVMSAVSCIVLASPHFFYGSGPDALALTKEYGRGNLSHFHIGQGNISYLDKEVPKMNGLCTEDPKLLDFSTEGNDDIGTPLLIFLSQFLLGVGNTLYYTLGQPYMDDNTKKQNAAMLLGLSMSLRILGPMFGFFVVYLCLRLYVNPTLTPTIAFNDPRWTGAWWLGWVIMSVMMLIVGFLISLFPKKLPKPGQVLTYQEEVPRPLEGNLENPKCEDLLLKPLSTEDFSSEVEALQPLDCKDDHNVNGSLELHPKAVGFFKKLMKLMKNKLLMASIFSGAFYVLSNSGTSTFLSRLMEVQWYTFSAGASATAGPIIVGGMAFGSIASGWFITKFKPRPVFLLGWNVFTGLVSTATDILSIYLTCPDIEIVGYDRVTNSLNFMNSCNEGCGCESVKFAPVCHRETQLTFISPCHAGCSGAVIDGLLTAYTNCSCIPTSSASSPAGVFEFQSYNGQLSSGFCIPDCFIQQTLFFSMYFIVKFLGSTGKIGTVIIGYRAVDPEDKSFSTGISLFIISLFAFIPGPVIFGYLLDSACLFWDNTGGSEGACWFYDRTRFSVLLYGTTAVFTFIGTILNVFVCYLGRDVNLYDDDDEEEDEATRQISTTETANNVSN